MKTQSIDLNFIIKNTKHEIVNIDGISYHRYSFSYDEYPGYDIDKFQYIEYFTNENEQCNNPKLLELQYQRKTKLKQINTI